MQGVCLCVFEGVGVVSVLPSDTGWETWLPARQFIKIYCSEGKCLQGSTHLFKLKHTQTHTYKSTATNKLFWNVLFFWSDMRIIEMFQVWSWVNSSLLNIRSVMPLTHQTCKRTADERLVAPSEVILEGLAFSPADTQSNMISQYYYFQNLASN